MANDQVTAGAKPGQQVVHDAGLGFRVEVDHHVAQEDHVELADIGVDRVHQVDLLEAGSLAQFRRDQEGS